MHFINKLLCLIIIHTTAVDAVAGQVEPKQIHVGDVLQMNWANGICNAMINIVAAVVLWIGGELTWVGRFSSTTSTETIEQWISKGLQWNELEQREQLCVSRAACEAPRVAKAYVQAVLLVSNLFRHFNWQPPNEDSMEVAMRVFNEGSSGKGLCKLSYPCHNIV